MIMRTAFIIVMVLTIKACAPKTGEQNNSPVEEESTSTIESIEDLNNRLVDEAPSELIVGERIDGPANIRDSINGKVLFTLQDNTLVTCIPLKDDWYVIGLLMDIDTSEFGINEVKKDRRIVVDGKVVGDIKSDMAVQTGTNYQEAWADLIGYTHKGNIKPNSIIEKSLSAYMETEGNGRSLEKLRRFIQNFDLKKDDQFPDYTVYYNYESWLEDPSPMWRIGLVFRNNTLVAILHSRPLEINGTTDHTLDRGFDCLTFDDINNSEEIVRMFNHFVNTVD